MQAISTAHGLICPDDWTPLNLEHRRNGYYMYRCPATDCQSMYTTLGNRIEHA